MFGQPQWFRPKSVGWGLVPITWQGWAYSGLWTGAIALPFLLLMGRYQPVEAMTWMSLGIAALGFDVWQIRRAMLGGGKPTVGGSNAPTQAAKHDENVLYILDNTPTPVATRNYNLQMRR